MTDTTKLAELEARAKQRYPYTRQQNGEIHASNDGSNWFVYYGKYATSDTPQTSDDTELDDILTQCFSNYSDEVAHHIAGDIAEAKQALLAWSARREAAARIDELQRLDTHRHYGKDYQDSLDELDEYKDNRIKQLTSDRTGGGKEQA